ncbi:MAG: hypothetical protein WCK05_06395 [Planctomycetota bacterium]
MTWNLNEVTHIEYRGRHVYRIRFDDGLEGDVDFSEFLGRAPILSPLGDLSFFRQARIDGGTIAGPTAPTSPRRFCTRRSARVTTAKSAHGLVALRYLIDLLGPRE